jgi:hypothetical protein
VLVPASAALLGALAIGACAAERDRAGDGAGAAGGKPRAAPGHEHHAGGATTSNAEGHSRAAKVACAALR